MVNATCLATSVWKVLYVSVCSFSSGVPRAIPCATLVWKRLNTNCGECLNDATSSQYNKILLVVKLYFSHKQFLGFKRILPHIIPKTTHTFSKWQISNCHKITLELEQHRQPPMMLSANYHLPLATCIVSPWCESGLTATARCAPPLSYIFQIITCILGHRSAKISPVDFLNHINIIRSHLDQWFLTILD